jgi:hypothetical protein
MPTFTIETDNNITAFAAVEDALNHASEPPKEPSPPRRNSPNSRPPGRSPASPKSGTASPAWCLSIR